MFIGGPAMDAEKFLQKVLGPFQTYLRDSVRLFVFMGYGCEAQRNSYIATEGFVSPYG